MTAARKLEQVDQRRRVNRYWRRWDRASQAISKKIELWRVLDIYDRGDQWKDANIPPWVPKPMSNYIRYVRTIKRANLASAIPMSHFTPIEQKFAQDVNKLQMAYEHVWEWEKVARKVRWAVDRALLKGTSVMYVYDDTNYVGGVYKDGSANNKLYQGKICVKHWPIDTFFIDPDACTIQEAKYIDTTEVLPLWSIKRNPEFRKYCKEQGTLEKLNELTSDQLEYDDLADGTTLNRDHKVTESTDVEDEDYMATLHTHWERYMDDNGRYRLDVTYYLRNTDFLLYRVENVKPSIYPFVAYIDEKEEKEFHGTSTCMEILENQRVINKTTQTYSIIATMHQNPQKVVTRSSGINAQEVALAGTIPGKVWTSNDVDPQKSLVNVQPPDIPQGLFEVDNAMKEDIRERLGINQAYTGQSVGSLTTSTGVRSLIERSSVRDKDKMSQIDEFVEELSNLIVMIILYKWKDERSISKRKPDGTVEYSKYEPIEEDVADQLEWMVKCDTYAVAPMTEETRKQEAQELLDIQGKYSFSPAVITPQEFIRMGNFKDKELILDRMQKDLEMMQKQQQSQPPKINPNGEISFALSSKDPNVVMDALQQMMQQAVIQQMNNLQLEAAHINNGLNVTPERPQAGTQAQAPNGQPPGTFDAQARAAMGAGQ